jgi:transposase
VVDWPLQRVEYVENRIQWKACPTCQQVASSVFPKDVSAPIQFGPRLGALALYLSQQQFLPNERTCQVLPDSSRSAIATADYLARLVPSASGSAPHQTTGGTRLYGLTSS